VTLRASTGLMRRSNLASSRNAPKISPPPLLAKPGGFERHVSASGGISILSLGQGDYGRSQLM